MPHPGPPPWKVTSDAFPIAGSTGDQLRFLLNYAILAPSIRNTQPWRFQVRGPDISLCADRTRQLQGIDADGREMVKSIGAALFLLRVAIRFFGRRESLVVLPNGNRGDPLVNVRAAPGGTPSKRDLALFLAITQRRRLEGRFAPTPVAADVRDFDLALAPGVGAAVHWVSPVHREPLAQLVNEAVQEYGRTPPLRREVAEWTGGDRWALGDGMADYEGCTDPTALANDVQVWAGIGERLAGSVREAPLVALLASATDEQRAWLDAGQALAELLLLATAVGLRAKILNQPLHLPRSVQALRRLLGTDRYPQFLVAIGHGAAAPPSPRRPLEDVLDCAPSSPPGG